ncbi:hypothetical protein [Noviherbaspirillum pedocola]|uniref:Uncharacterized protein n=1 Tax=Noviherbaspirillum pedocola TaxID=2801341 RepID=A0A934SPV1_9BURK|nr:hypothetical protein [Noviherbaspirillum pedocola]MBK4733113.1 hypothetical protein [Noviherbaspirillum pedocola]
MRISSTLACALYGFLACASFSAQAVSCMVLGESQARVQALEGEKSPVFLTASCESLRLISGKAMVSWVSRDGKPHFAAIGKDGAATLPTAGAEERASNVVWAELSSKREADRPAFMRALNESRPARVYIPPEGLALAARADANFRILALQGDTETLVFEKTAAESKPILLTRERILPGTSYLIEWHHPDSVEKIKWQTVGAEDTARIDEEYRRIDANIEDLQQRRIMKDILFEQLRLRVNMSSVLARS